MADIDEISHALGHIRAQLESGEKRFDRMERSIEAMTAAFDEIKQDKARAFGFLAAIGAAAGAFGSWFKGLIIKVGG